MPHCTAPKAICDGLSRKFRVFCHTHTLSLSLSLSLSLESLTRNRVIAHNHACTKLTAWQATAACRAQHRAHKYSALRVAPSICALRSSRFPTQCSSLGSAAEHIPSVGVSGPCSQGLAVRSSLAVPVGSAYTISCLPWAASSEWHMHEAHSRETQLLGMPAQDCTDGYAARVSL